VGTETDGSIVSPAASCCLVGLKPTVGLVPGDGIIPISASQDSAGPMARTVRDAALLLDAMAGTPGHHAGVCEPGALRGARIGVLREPWIGANRHADRAYEEALRALADAGAVLVDPVAIDTAEELRSSDCELTVLLHEFRDGLSRYLATRPDMAVRSLADVIEFNRRHADVELPYFGQETFERAEAAGPLTDETYLEALALGRRLTREEGIDATLARHALDALVVPCSSPPAAIELVSPGGRGWASTMSASRVPAIAGYPIISVPAGFVFGELPVALRLFAGAGSERTLLALAYDFERATAARRSPRYLPTLDLP